MPSPARLDAISHILERGPVPTATVQSLQELWASDVFSLDKMKSALPKDVFKSIQRTIKEGGKLDASVANIVAQAMKDWATSRGALYYAHEFNPLTNLTAEKHDGFIAPQSDGTAIAEFTGAISFSPSRRSRRCAWAFMAALERSSGVFLSSASPVQLTNTVGMQRVTPLGVCISQAGLVTSQAV